MAAVVEGRRRSRVDLVTPGFSHKSDQRLKVESMCPLQQIYSHFQFNLLLNCPLCSCSTAFSCPSGQSGYQPKGEVSGRRATLCHLCPSVALPAQHIGRKGEKYILQPFDEQQGNKFINHHYMPHQTLCQPLHGSYTN